MSTYGAIIPGDALPIVVVDIDIKLRTTSLVDCLRCTQLLLLQDNAVDVHIVLQGTYNSKTSMVAVDVGQTKPETDNATEEKGGERAREGEEWLTSPNPGHLLHLPSAFEARLQSLDP